MEIDVDLEDEAMLIAASYATARNVDLGKAVSEIILGSPESRAFFQQDRDFAAPDLPPAATPSGN